MAITPNLHLVKTEQSQLMSEWHAADNTNADLLDSWSATVATKATADLTNYYLKTQLYTKEEINNLIATINSTSFVIVPDLPAKGESVNIYLLRNSNPDLHNSYDEYIWASNAWEKIGTTEIDLSNYYTKTEVDSATASISAEVNELTANINESLQTFNNVLESKQDVLVPGDNVEIIDNTISVDIPNTELPLLDAMMFGQNIDDENTLAYLASSINHGHPKYIPARFQVGFNNFVQSASMNYTFFDPEYPEDEIYLEYFSIIYYDESLAPDNATLTTFAENAGYQGALNNVAIAIKNSPRIVLYKENKELWEDIGINLNIICSNTEYEGLPLFSTLHYVYNSFQNINFSGPFSEFEWRLHIDTKILQENKLPEISEADSGKVLGVTADGEYDLVTVSTPSVKNTLYCDNVISSATWQEAVDTAPYTYFTEFVLNTNLDISGDNVVIELINNNPILFAKHGFAIVSVDPQTKETVLYSVDQPLEDVVLKIGVTT